SIAASGSGPAEMPAAEPPRFMTWADPAPFAELAEPAMPLPETELTMPEPEPVAPEPEPFALEPFPAAEPAPPVFPEAAPFDMETPEAPAWEPEPVPAPALFEPEPVPVEDLEPPVYAAPEPGYAEPAATMTLGELYLRQGHLQEARRIFGEILEREPDHAAAHDGLERVGQALTARERRPVEASELLAGFDPDAAESGANARKVFLLNSYLARVRRGRQRDVS
ncbi:MAG TPA: tetratricopeptide repeat protein, partial [Thermoanaerobaculia bacterium]|nr:tetratricopeptide repeat protein [Thermoanaerobaculia bacterium]